MKKADSPSDFIVQMSQKLDVSIDEDLQFFADKAKEVSDCLQREFGQKKESLKGMRLNDELLLLQAPIKADGFMVYQ